MMVGCYRLMYGRSLVRCCRWLMSSAMTCCLALNGLIGKMGDVDGGSMSTV